MGSLLYKLAKNTFYLYFKLIHHLQVKGKENRNHQGSLIVMANHISYLDPPLVGSVIKRRVHFMAKEELFKNPLLGWVLQLIGTFPVKRGRPDRKAIKKAYNVLESDNILGIFPEGTRHKPGRLGSAKPGAVMIAIKSKSPILPIGIKNINENKNTLVSIGKPFTLENYYDRKLSREELKEAGEFIMKKIKEQIDLL